MSRIKFYGKYDMTCPSFINRSIDYIKNFDINKEVDINDILEYFNILKYYDSFKEIFQDYREYEKNINLIIGKIDSRFTCR